MNSVSGKLPEGGSPEVARSVEPPLKAMDADQTMAAAATALMTDLNSLSDRGLPEGTKVFVWSNRSYWSLSKRSTATLADNSIRATHSGTGRWMRTEEADPTWALRGTWVIDPTNGNDDYDGALPSTALKTHDELARRWGHGYPLLPGVPSSVISAIQLISVTVRGHLPPTDPIDIRVTLGPNTLLAYLGTVEFVRSGTLSAVTVKDRKTNTPWAITADFTAADLDQRVRITAGANLDQFAWVAKDLGGNSVRMSSFSTPTMPGTADVLIQANLLPEGRDGSVSVGDRYSLEKMNRAYIRQIDARTAANGTNTFPTIGFVNFDFQTYGGPFQKIPMVLGQVQGMFKSCKFSGQLAVGLANVRANFLNCHMGNYNKLSTAAAVDVVTPIVVRGGMARGTVAVRNWGVSAWDDDFMVVEGGFAIQVSGMVMGRVCSFDSPLDGFRISSNAGVGASPACLNVIPTSSDKHLLWGSGHLGYGLNLLPNCSLAYEKTIPTVTGAAGDFKLGSASATAFYFDEVTGKYVRGITAAAGGWAAMATAQPRGYGGNAHQPDRNSHIVRIKDS
jgi:hypothetical protein